MEHKEGQFKREEFAKALEGKKLPVLTLDNKWYRLLNKLSRESVKSLEEELNTLLKRQGKIHTETKEIKFHKKKLMNDIVTMVDELEQSRTPGLEKKIEDTKKLIDACNERLESYRDEMMELPGQIDQVNLKLMLMTMEYCYKELQENTSNIREISDWVTEVRIQLKKQLVRKQELELQNHEIYTYMHDIFGADVVDMFDMQYNPEEKFPRKQKDEE
ncbi:MAG: hypothetical protein IJ335_09920 [Lachnospiraceae bacterium]|nr:hypothetical protein [Lachnospiraceae bacterium]